MTALDESTPVSPLALGALALVMLGGLVLGVLLFREHRDLAAELAALRAGASPGAAQADAPPSAESARIFAELERESALLRAAEAQAIEIGKSLPPLSNEEWRSLGRVEELGRQAADFVRTSAEWMVQINKGGAPSEAHGKAFAHQLTAWIKRMDAIGEMEDDPAEVARLHTATLSMRLKLDTPTQARVQQEIEREFTQLRAQQLTRMQRPDTERDAWYARRSTALNAATQRIEALIPAGQRQEFAVGQSLHLGTGLRTKTEIQSDGRGSMSLLFHLPGIHWQF